MKETDSFFFLNLGVGRSELKDKGQCRHRWRQPVQGLGPRASRQAKVTPRPRRRVCIRRGNRAPFPGILPRFGVWGVDVRKRELFGVTLQRHTCSPQPCPTQPSTHPPPRLWEHRSRLFFSFLDPYRRGSVPDVSFSDSISLKVTSSRSITSMGWFPFLWHNNTPSCVYLFIIHSFMATWFSPPLGCCK